MSAEQLTPGQKLIIDTALRTVIASATVEEARIAFADVALKQLREQGSFSPEILAGMDELHEAVDLLEKTARNLLEPLLGAPGGI